jgi:hypothetical protein
MSEVYEEEWGNLTALSGYKTIASADALGGYEWDQFHVLRGPDGRLYVGDGSGCSCNYFGDTSPADLAPVESWQDAGNRAQEWAQNPEFPWHERRAGVAYELCATLARVRPAAVLAPNEGGA